MKRVTVVPAALAIAAVVAVAGVVAVTSSATPARAASHPSVDTVRVQERTLSARVAEPGTLTYRGQPGGTPYAVISQGGGTYTELPAAGRVVMPGQVLYRVDNHPVVLLHGSTPAYRALSPGERGPDVQQLDADLVALGYAAKAALNPESSVFGPATAVAVKKLQAHLGETQSGRLALGQAVFAPTALRVANVSAALGARSQPGDAVLQATSTTRQVQLSLDASQQATVAVGDRVTITLPDGRTIPGVVSSVGAVATCASNAGAGAAGSSSAPPGTDACSATGSQASAPTVAVGVTPSNRAATGRWDQAPVQVGITTASVRDALVVPVTALLATSGTGYAVEVAGAGQARHLVPVTLGLFDDADGLVAVAGAGLSAGQDVVVPAA